VLLVDDDPAIARLVAHAIEQAGFASLTLATSGRQALDSLDGIDIVLLDHQLPDSEGLDILDAIRGRPNPPAVVLITAHGSESLAAAALRRGADDYLAKDASLPGLLPEILERVRRGRELHKALGAAERDLVRAERLGAIGEMTVTLHHGINNPLMAATADVELLLTGADLPEDKRKEALRGIRDSLHRIRDIVRHIGDLREIQSKTYLPGIKMVDLDGPTAPVQPIFRGMALLVVPEEDLARVVGLLLRDAGFGVERCADVSELKRSLSRPTVSLVLVMGGTGAAGAHPLGGFTPPKRRDYRVVALVSGNPSGALGAGADSVVQLPFDPVGFTAEMVRLAS
jgi:DNA-binding response OmpR family regulator